MNAIAQKSRPQVAETAKAQAAAVEQTQYLTFMLGGEMFAIGILGIKEIIEFEEMTSVPMMPECIRGVINMRGSVVPVMDLSTRFGKTMTAVTKRTCIIIVEVEANGKRHDMGVVVDAVNAVLEIPRAEIEAPPTFGSQVRTDFIEGMGKVQGKFVILLNVDRVLSADDIGAMTQLAVPAESLQAA